MNRQWSRILFGVGVFALLVFPIVIYIMTSPMGAEMKMQVFPGPTPDLVSVPRFVTVDKRLVMTKAGTVASYLLHGRAASFSTISHGMEVTFVLDGDPLHTYITVRLANTEGRYQLLTYSLDFGQQFRQQFVDAQTVEQIVKNPEKLIEFHMALVPKPAPEVKVALDEVQSGNWHSLPAGLTINADMIGIAETK